MMMKKITALIVTSVFCVNHVYAQTTPALVIPTAPNYASCPGPANDICHQTADRNYQIQLANYAAAKRQQDLLDAQRAAAQTATKDAAQKAEDLSSAGKKKYGIENVVSLGIAAYAAYQAATCGLPPCQVPFVALAALMTMNALKARQQAASAKATQYASCTTANQVSSVQTICGAEPPPYSPPTTTTALVDGTNFPPNLIDSNGNCTGSQDLCSEISSKLPPGATLRDVNRGLSQFASGKVPLKINPDGTVQTSDGKKFDLSALNNPSSLAAAGLTQGMIKALTGGDGSKNNASGLGDTSAKSASGTGQVADLGQFDDASGIGKSGAGGIGFGVNGEANGSGLDGDKNRSIASASAEGLVRDFNGENIGVQGDDIFKMMKRRYLLKDKQDSFLSAPPAPTP